MIEYSAVLVDMNLAPVSGVIEYVSNSPSRWSVNEGGNPLEMDDIHFDFQVSGATASVRFKLVGTFVEDAGIGTWKLRMELIAIGALTYTNLYMRVRPAVSLYGVDGVLQELITRLEGGTMADGEVRYIEVGGAATTPTP